MTKQRCTHGNMIPCHGREEECDAGAGHTDMLSFEYHVCQCGYVTEDDSTVSWYEIYGNKKDWRSELT
jgi:hypothetical protein